MGKVRISLLLVLGVLCALALTSCSSSSNTVTITLSPTTPPALTQGETLAITATVANDTNNEGVTWSITGVGSLSNSTTTSVTYNAPPTLSTNSSATITATSIASTTVTATLSISVNAVLTIITTSLPAATLNTPYTTYVNAQGATGPFTWALSAGNLPIGLSLGTSTGNSVVISGTPTVLGTSSFTIEVTDPAGTSVSQALSITVNKPPPLSVATTFLPDGSVGAPYGQTLQASSGTKPYSWSYTGSLPAGLSLSAEGVISGTPTTIGMSSFTVQVTDSSTPQQQASARLSITIEPSSANNSKLVGNYAFLVSGFDPNGHFVAAGSFVADGSGNIGSGIMDTNDPSTLLTQQGFSGTYLIGSNDLGTMTFVTGTGTRSFALALSADGSAASIIEFDDHKGTGTRDSGVLLRQDVSAFTRSAITGDYAFGFLGADAQSPPNRFGMAGAFHADGAGNFSNGLLDSDDAGTLASSVAFTGTYSVAPSSGRGTATIAIPGQGTTNYSFYVVSANQLLVMEIDYISGQTSPIVSGSILSQGGFSLNGTSVFETTALSGTTPQTQVGLLQGNGSGGLSLTSDLNTGGTLTSPAGSGTYSVASNGRVTLTNSGFQTSDPVLYLVAPNEAFIIGTDAGVTFGFMQPQTGTPFTNASLSGTYAGGSIAPVDSSVGNEASIAVADGVGNFTFTTDASSTSGLLENQVSAATYSVASNGRVVVTENGSQAAILYLISPTQYGLLTAVPADPDVRVDLFQQ